MALSAGTHLGPYEILSALGAGGMGEVYRARDTRLDRTVAVKILPSTDPDLKARFEREAKAIAALTHPHICTLYDVGHQGDTDYLVMECLEGETLAARLQRGALPVGDALRHAIEMAGALDKAHRAGFVHRDLKPANIILTKEGAKLVDFGLATLRTTAAHEAVAGLTTVAPDRALTGKGTILGTIQYMAPEQVEGQPTDARTDIFAFGAVLYEMLTGQRAFEGGSPASLIAAILRATPPPVSARQPLVSAALEHIVSVCLAKDPDERWQTAADLRRELHWAGVDGSRADPPAAAAVGRRGWPAVRLGALSVVLGAAVLGTSAWIWTLPRVTTPRAVTRSAIALPPGTRLSDDQFRGAVAISPDGRTIVFAADGGAGSQLYARPLDALAATPIAGTAGATGPFFSPDGQWVGFSADNRMRKVALSGGAPQVICETSFRGATWGDDGMILFSDRPGKGLSRVSANGGIPEIVTIPDRDRREKSHRRPSLLPGGKAVILTVGTADISSFDDARIDVLTLATGARKVLIQGGMFAQYLSSGHLLYARAGSLLAVPFDVERLEVTGPPVTVVADVFTQPDFGVSHFAVSRDGSLVYASGGAHPYQTTLVWVDRQGRSQPVTDTRRAFDYVSLSPDSQRIAVQIDQATVEVWVYDLARATFTRLAHGWDSGSAIWSPDGAGMTIESNRATASGRNLFRQPADGTGSAERLTTDPLATQTPESWSPDGRLLVFSQYDGSGNGNADLWVWSTSERKARPLLQTPASELEAKISPDGQWIAYQSNQSGRFEVYVQAFPGPSRNWPVSLDGGTSPRWARTGRELFYRKDDLVMAVDISTTPGFTAGRPKRLFEGSYLRDSYDVAGDGRFLMIKEDPQPVTQLNLVQNWFEDLKQRTRR